MASRKEQKERLRREREERERRAREAEQRKRLVGYGVAGALVLAVAVVLVALFAGGGGGGGNASADVLPDGGEPPAQEETDLRAAVAASGCKLESRPARSREHTDDPNERIDYATDPPISGKHYVQDVDEGAYSEAPTDEALVHNLEHGRVVVWFKPSLPADTRADLKALFEEDSFQTLFVPRANMPYAVAASAWRRDPVPLGTGNLLGCERFGASTFDALRAFRDEHRGDGPEAVP